MRHRYECPTRWADLDLLGHVNNVSFVDYLQEARVDLLRTQRAAVLAEGGEAPLEGIIVVRHEVSYRAPLRFRFRPVVVECWVSEIRAGRFTLSYEVFHDDGDDGERVVYLRAATVLAPFVFAGGRPRRLTAEERDGLARYLEPEPARPASRPRPVPRTEHGHYPVHVRFSDVDAYRHVNNVTYVEYFQEARLRLMASLSRALDLPPISVVVAQADVDYRVPLLHRSAPYDCWSHVVALGERSMTIESEILDGDQVCARARVVLVFFDPETQRSTTPPEGWRARLAAVVEASPDAVAD